MLSPGPATRIFLAAGVTDMRKSFDGGSGLWVCACRLEKGTFHWPRSDQESVELTHAQLHLLLGGIDLDKTKNRRWIR